MGKEGELWDDSALINALDDAVSNYKVMHGKGHLDSSKEEEKDTRNTVENLSDLVDEGYEVKRHTEADTNNNIASNTTKGTEENNNLPPLEENHCGNSCAQGSYVDSSSGQHVQDAQGISDAQGAEDYNQLLNQYYELEDQRQKVLTQLHQYGSWNYQGFSSDVQYNTSSTSQEHQVPAIQASYPATTCTCCPYASLPSSAPCSMGGTFLCSSCGTASAICCDGKPISLGNGSLVETAMGAAEKALSSLKMKTSSNDPVLEGKREEANEVQMAHSTTSKTDLTEVLNAWYSAGFFTGKYLVEQSSAKKGPA